MDLSHLVRVLSDGFGNPPFMAGVCAALATSAVTVALFAWRSSSPNEDSLAPRQCCVSICR